MKFIRYPAFVSAALLMTISQALAQKAPLRSPQTFVLTPDKGCSITSSDLREQFRVPGLIKGWTHYDIMWSARWDTTGCKLPIFVQVSFNYLDYKKDVALTRYWSIKVPKEHFLARGELSEKTKVTVQVQSVRLMRIGLETEAQYNAGHQKH